MTFARRRRTAGAGLLVAGAQALEVTRPEKSTYIKQGKEEPAGSTPAPISGSCSLDHR